MAEKIKIPLKSQISKKAPPPQSAGIHRNTRAKPLLDTKVEIIKPSLTLALETLKRATFANSY